VLQRVREDGDETGIVRSLTDDIVSVLRARKEDSLLRPRAAVRLNPFPTRVSRRTCDFYRIRRADPESVGLIARCTCAINVQIVRNFRDRRTGLVPGGCPLLNTAIDSDDGNPQLRAKARLALSSLLDRLQSIAEEGQRRDEVRADVDSAQLATLIASTLEGSIMVSRLQKKEEARDLAVRHLEEYLESRVRAQKSRRSLA
jgi:hypothetical protein